MKLSKVIICQKSKKSKVIIRPKSKKSKVIISLGQWKPSLFSQNTTKSHYFG